MPSSVVSSFYYDSNRSVLVVVFVSGTVYEYFNVPEEAYKAMKASTSKGSYLNNRIKGKYDFKKVG